MSRRERSHHLGHGPLPGHFRAHSHEHRQSWRMRLPLQRRLFWWFGACILGTAAVVAAIMGLLSAGTGPAWQRQFEEGKAFVAARFAEAWDVPGKREALATEMTERFGVRVILRDAAGQELFTSGVSCTQRRPLVEPVMRNGARLGEVDVCTPRQASNALRFLLPLLGAIAVLWLLSHKFAGNLARPLVELERVAKTLGEGNLSARVTLDRRFRGESRVVGEAMNEMAARIEKQLSDQRELLAAVSHELRTPLSRMRVLLELARDLPAPTKQLDELDREVVEVDALVGELLANARVDFSALRLTAVDPVDAAVRAIERAALPPERLIVEGEKRTVSADATLLSRALANLLDNAKKHGGGSATLRVSNDPSGVTFAVEDEGQGFEPGDEARAFDPFYRKTNSEAAEARSLGLGLSLVKRIAEAHRGRAFAENRTPKGARVGFSLPG